jgi:hypothetical protein
LCYEYSLPGFELSDDDDVEDCHHLIMPLSF